MPTRFAALAVTLLAALPLTATAQTNGTWIGTATGAWSTPANWQGGVVANGSGASATFATANLATPITVTLDTSRTIGSLVFDNPTNNFGWTVGGSTTLTLAGGATPTISVGANNANVQATISTQLAGNQGFNKTGGGTLFLTDVNNMTGGITVTGGVLSVTRTAAVNPLGANAVNLAGGTLRLGFVPSLPFATTGGYNSDVVRSVADPNANPYGTTATVDTSGFVFYENGIPGAPATGGLPGGDRTFVSAINPAVTFQLQGYGDSTANNNNSIRLTTAGSSDPVVLTTPRQFQTLNVVHTTGQGSSTYTLTLNFSDGSSTTYNNAGAPFGSADWFNGTPFALGSLNRFNINDGTFQNAGTNPRLYQTDISLTAADRAKTVNSIVVNYIGGGGVLNVFGFSGFGGASIAQNFAANNVNVTADSTIDVRSPDGAATLGALAIGGQTLSFTGSTGSTVTLGATTLGGNPTFNAAAGVTAVLGAVSDGGTARTITKSGDGTLTLGGAGTVAAGTTVNINAGTLNSNNATALGAGAAVTVNAGTFGVGASQTIASLAGTSGAVALNANALTINGAANTTFAGGISGAGGSLVRSGTGTTTLSGTGPYGGGVTINTGAKIVATSPGALGTGAVTLAGGTLAVGGIQGVTVTGFGGDGTGWTPNGGATVAANDLTLTTAANDNTRSFWFNNQVPVRSFTASFTYQVTSGSNPPADGATFTLHNSAQGTAALGGGGGQLGYGGITPSAALAINIFTGVTGGQRGVQFFTNGQNVGGPYQPVTPVNLVDPANPVSGNPIDFTITYNSTAHTITLNLAEQTTANTFNIVLPNVNLQSILGSATSFMGFTGATGGLNAEQHIRNFSFVVPDQHTYANAVNVPAAATPTVNVAATAAVPVITMGALTLGNASSLTVGAETGTPAGLAYGLTFGATTVNGPATVNVNNNTTGTGTLTLGALSGTGALTKTGPGTLVLPAAASGYTGAINVNGGRLLARNTTGMATGTGTVTVNTGGTVGGTGTIGGALVLNSGGSVSPGLSVGQLTVVGASTWNGGATYTFELAPTAGSATQAQLDDPASRGVLYDHINGTGALSLAGASAANRFIIDIVPTTQGSAPRNFVIATFAGGVTDFAADKFNFVGNGFTGTPSIALNGNNLVLTFQPVPEPVHLLLVCGAAAGAARWYRRRGRTVTA